LPFQDEDGHCNFSQNTATVSTYDLTKPKNWSYTLDTARENLKVRIL
jgi:hypothetical protein